MDPDEIRQKILSVLTQEPLCTSELKAKAGLKCTDHVNKILNDAVNRGEARHHGNKSHNEGDLWSLP